MKHPFLSRALSRRNVLKLAGGCAAMTAGPVLSTISGLNLTKSAWAAAPTTDSEDFKALVCVYLFGGNDSFNMLVPCESAEYADYQTVRGELALAKEDLLAISDESGRSFGLHPSMAGMQSLYNDGDVAFVSNVGALVRPTTKEDVERNLDLPLGLFSHPDQARHWQTSIPESRVGSTGWAGRMADILTDTVNDNLHIAMNIAIDSVNLFQTGRNVVPYVVEAKKLSGYNGISAVDRIYSQATDAMLANPRGNVMERAFAAVKRGSIDAAISYADAIDGISLQTEFPETKLGEQLELVARTISARQTLGQRRQVYFALVQGWDFHDEVLNAQQKQLQTVNDALVAFNSAMHELSVHDKVTTFTASDFGRTLTSNGNGTDHAWGGNQMIMGGAVNGGMFGQYPLSLRDDNLDIGRGRLLPTTSVDEFNAELAMWFGIENDNNLEAILPNIRRFYGAGSATGPLGFLS